jgi:translation elongation factor EF-1beta/uncharacterized membrane protein YheB (UPF0754 family)|eukprot:g7116.t1
MSSQKVGTVEDGEGKGSSNEITFSYNLKPFSDEDDMEGLAATLKTVTFDGLVKWGDHELVKIAFGLKMLKITVTINDDVASTDDLEAMFLDDGRDDVIQSVEICDMIADQQGEEEEGASEPVEPAQEEVKAAPPSAEEEKVEGEKVEEEKTEDEVQDTAVEIDPPAEPKTTPKAVRYDDLVNREHTFQELYCTYGSVSNYVTFSLLVIGMILQWAFPNTSAIPYLLSFGLFGFAGGFTNWLAVKMLFDKIPFLYGSGVIPRQFKEIRETVKTTIMATFFDEQYLGSYLNERSRDLLGKINVKDRVQKIVQDPDTEGLIAAELEKLALTPEGAFLAMLPMMMPGMTMRTIAAMMKKPLGGFATQMAEKLTQSFDILEFVSVESVRNEIDSLMTEKLKELTPPMVKKLMEDVIRQHLGWLIVWGNVFGGLLGIISQGFGYGV